MNHTPIAEPSTDAPRKPRTRRGRAFQVAAVTLTLAAALAGTGLARWIKGPAAAEGKPAATGLKMPPRLFPVGGKPDLVLLLSAEQHGYLLPCGCSRPQVGGMERRYNFIRLLQQRGWPVVALDLGDLPQRHGPVSLPNLQGLIKYRYAMKSLEKMGYSAVGIGEYEAALSLFGILGEYALNETDPRVLAANLVDADKNFPDQTKPWQLAHDVRGPKVAPPIAVGVTSIIGPRVAQRIGGLKDPAVTFGPSRKALDSVLREMAGAKVELPVLLYQGLINGSKKGESATEAVACAKVYPQFPIILCLSEEDEPPGVPTVVTHPTGAVTRVISLGHKGKYVGVVGVYRTGDPKKPLEFKYQLVELSEDFLTPAAAEAGHPIINLMEEYTRELRRDHYLERYTRDGRGKHRLQVMDPVPGLARPGEPTYIGTEKCKNCHEHAYDIWKKTRHSHAYQTLVNKQRPSLRQFDGECVVCHVTGFPNQGGFTDADTTPHLRNVGCESCHGPGSVHAANSTNKEWQARMNPWKAPEKETATDRTRRLNRIDQFCQSCHDIDNDVTWIHGAFEKTKWPAIAHPNPTE